MRLHTAVELLALSPDTDWAVAHLNCHTSDLLRAALTAARAEKAPVILAVGPQTIDHSGLRPVAAMIRAAADETEVPIALHLDHAKDLVLVREALAAGFSSVMFDGSALNHQDNIRLTGEVVRMAHDKGASAEGEIGIVPHDGAAPGQTVTTDPSQAIEFARKTGVDLLAVSVGSVHNMRSQGASLDVDLIRTIHEATGVPLVLHGGSGVLDADIQAGIPRGLRKININTALKMAMVDGIAEGLARDPRMDFLALMRHGIDRAAAFAAERIRLFNASGKAAA